MRPAVILARHGSTLWNDEGRLQGASDQPLSTKGQDQALALADWLMTQAVTSILTSNLRRAVETAAIVARRLGVSYASADALRERDVGKYEGLTAIELREARSRYGLRTDDLYQDWQGAEDVEADMLVASRVQPLIEESLKRGSAKDCVVLITHAGVIKSYLHTSFRIPPTRVRCFKVYAGSAVSLIFHGGLPQIIDLWQNPQSRNPL